MAYGMNEVEERANAYKGNPQALEQRYAQNQQLIDLLALQKLKSDMEAAKRDLMLKSPQQGQQGTVKDQLGRQVLDMTKEDVAKRVTDVARQRQQEEQSRMRQLMQMGVASAPAPNMARMAGGGIVAFAGEEGSLVPEVDTGPEAGAKNRVPPRPLPKIPGDPSVYAWDRKYGATHNPDGTPKKPPAPTEPLIPYVRDPESTKPPSERPYIPKEEAEKKEYRKTVEPLPFPGSFGQANRDTPPRPAELAPIELPPEAMPTPAAAANKLPSLPAGAGGVSPQTQSGLASLSTLLPATTGPANLAAKQAEETRIRQMYEATLGTPEEQRQRRLKRFLLGAANRSGIGSIMAGGLAGSLQEEERQQRLLQGAIGQGVSGGQKVLEQAEMSSRQALQSGTQVLNSTLDRAFQEKKLLSDRQVAELNARVEQSRAAATNALQQAQLEANNLTKQEQALVQLNRYIAAEAEKIASRYQKSIRTAEMSLQAAKTDKERKEAQDQIDQLRRQAEAEAARATQDMREQADRIRQRMMAQGGVDTSQFKVEKVK